MPKIDEQDRRVHVCVECSLAAGRGVGVQNEEAENHARLADHNVLYSYGWNQSEKKVYELGDEKDPKDFPEQKV